MALKKIKAHEVVRDFSAVFCFYPFLCSLLFWVCLTPCLKAEEFTLSLKKAEVIPWYNYGFGRSAFNKVRWENQEGILTDRAKTLESKLTHLGIAEDQRFLVTIDTVADGIDDPDTLYVDLNQNRNIDENEKFDLIV
ncbi:MAG: hypothetical protein KJ645_05150, partial [Planctomycetes bacterium]|nr:hypothetical protein [Planctomycetota bacterium]